MSFNCFLNSGKYEYVRFAYSGAEFYLEENTNNFLDESGYYVMHAEDSVQMWKIDFIVPEDKYLSVVYIPYDNFTEIRVTDIVSLKIYTASVNRGEGVINIESHPDSAFRELAGTFSGSLVNIEDEADTMSVSNGYFVFVF
ncbi:MAG: hypothetical protein AB7T10_07050 [bacterium]